MPPQTHRLHALCPYFEMFPPSFVRHHLRAISRPGDVVLDPFSGRGTTLLESLLHDRIAIALDVNPVAACVSGAKANVPRFEAVTARLVELREELLRADLESIEE
ncbi:MAG: hypothetical protein FJ319_07240 [SAR202 cluster bacterium]|nr:hypothetical protein [SAR202 cluster bacterium]